MEGTHEKVKLYSPITLIGCLLLIFSCKQQPQKKLHTDYTTVEKTLRSGDLICRYGDGIWSIYLRNISSHEKRFSHVGIIIIESNRPYVIHASANDYSGIGKVAKEPFTTFINDSDDFAIYRITQSKERRERISTIALEYLGKPFDLFFDLHTKDKIYCSELIRLCVNAAIEENIIKTSYFEGKEIVPIDSCYSHSSFIKIIDIKE